jgi:Cu/Ag efflux protein CusF
LVKRLPEKPTNQPAAAVSNRTGGTLMKRAPTLILMLLAVALVLGLALPALAEEAKGKIKTLEPDKSTFTILDSANKDLTFTHDKDGKVFINDKESKLADLQVGDQVTVTYKKDGDKMLCTEVRAKRS